MSPFIHEHRNSTIRLHHKTLYIPHRKTIHLSIVINGIIYQLSPFLYYVYSDKCRQKPFFSITGWWVVILRNGTEQMNTGLSHQIHLLIIACSGIDIRLAHCEVCIQCQRQLYRVASTIIRMWKCRPVSLIHPEALLSSIILFC